MSVSNSSLQHTWVFPDARAEGRSRDVVACVLRHESTICCLRRSDRVGSDQGAWHLITGYLPPHTAPVDQALLEVEEETGIQSEQVQIVAESVIRFDSGWVVHAFLAESATTDVRLNWEHSDVIWVPEVAVRSHMSVAWAGTVLDAFRLAGGRSVTA